ncbi:MAG: calcium-binding protein [Thalassovita sp.]
MLTTITSPYYRAMEWDDGSLGLDGAVSDFDGTSILEALRVEAEGESPAMLVGRVRDLSGTGGLSDPFVIATEGNFTLTEVDIVRLVGGDIVAVWSSLGGEDGFGGGVYGRRFSADGTPSGDVFQISPDAPYSQRDPEVEATPNGGFAVAWEASTGTQGEGLVQFRTYDADGTAGEVIDVYDDLANLAGIVFDSAGVAHVYSALGGPINETLIDITTNSVIADGNGVAAQGSNPNSYGDGLLDVVATPDGGAFLLELFDEGRNGSAIIAAHSDISTSVPASSFIFDMSYEAGSQVFSPTVLVGDDLLRLYYFSDGSVVSRQYVPNARPEGEITVDGDLTAGSTLTPDFSDITDADGLGDGFSYYWFVGSGRAPLHSDMPIVLDNDDIGLTVLLTVTYEDGNGTTESLSVDLGQVTAMTFNEVGTQGDDFLEGGVSGDFFAGIEGNDTIIGNGGDDTIYGGDGYDRLNLGPGNDLAFGGASEADLGDAIFAGSGDDTIDAGYGNDSVYGGDGNDLIDGSYGADTLIGQAGNDSLSGGALADQIFGGSGDDFINGGFGFDRLNGGDGADRFFHVGVSNHGSDWVQDYTAAQGDVLQFGGAATRSQFQVNFETTQTAGAEDVQEAFVIYRPTGQILWALVDGAAQSEINLQLGNETYDLLA